MSGLRRVLLLMCAGLALLTAACSQVHISPHEKEAIVRLGKFNSRDQALIPVETIAGYYVPYALLSVRSYGDDKSGGERWDKLLNAVDKDGRPLRAKVLAWFSEWADLGHGDFADDYLPCSQKRIDEGRCNIKVPGIAYQVWARKNCSEIVVSFRGTNFSEVNDWITNFHWFTRLLPVYDQYEQVQDNVQNILDVMKAHCRGRKSVTLTAVGHSLGGGLAQQLAYGTAEITRVYAFDPSMVTGYYDLDIEHRNPGDTLEIDRVYEHGEILAYFRFFMRQFAPPSVCRPQIRNIRFDLLHGSVIDQHSMDGITAKLIEAAGTPTDWRKRRGKYVLPKASDPDVEPNLCRAGARADVSASGG